MVQNHPHDFTKKLIRFLERAMPKPYSVDLRARVIEDLKTGASRREATERYGISPSVVVTFREDRQRCDKAKRRQHLAA